MTSLKSRCIRRVGQITVVNAEWFVMIINAQALKHLSKIIMASDYLGEVKIFSGLGESYTYRKNTLGRVTPLAIFCVTVPTDELFALY